MMIKTGMFICDRYEIMEKVGSGGMADVYKAKCHRLNRNVAIKILKPEYSNDKVFVSKFRAEAQSAAGLSHPNIVSIYDVGEDEGLYFIVMELIEGITLKRFIERKGRLEIKEAVGIAIQIAQGMEAAHSNHIIHRDIKPQNIIISRDGKVKVTDFGIAKAATANTITQTVLGSVHYLSPEQARGGYSDERSDIYSLGVTLYEMLTGSLPFAGENTISVALLHIQSEAKTIRELDPDLPVSLDKIVQKCMQKKPERRYLSASDLIMDLKRSVTNPGGEFVTLSSGMITDSPTRHITDDEMDTIKTAAKNKKTLYGDMPTRSKRTTLYDDEEEPVKVRKTPYKGTPTTKKKSSKEMKRIQREDSEDIDSVDSRFEKFVVIGSVGVVIIFGIVILYFVIRFFNLLEPDTNNEPSPSPTEIVQATDPPSSPVPSPTEGPDGPTEPAPTADPDATDVIMPRVLGYSTEDAQRMVWNRFGDGKAISYEPGGISSEYAQGLIMRQEPGENEIVPRDSRIILYYSEGPPLKSIPNVNGYTLDRAKNSIEAEGFKVGETRYEYDDAVPAESVIMTIPAALEAAKEGDTVVIVVSQGPNVSLATVPSILGMTGNAAISELELNELEAGEPSYVNSDIYPAGEVCYQSISANEKVTKGTVIDYSISLGLKIVTYIGTVRIPVDQNDEDWNPIEPGESGRIVIDFWQSTPNGPIEKNLFNDVISYDRYQEGFNYSVESEYGGDAYIYVELDGQPVIMYTVQMVEQ